MNFTKMRTKPVALIALDAYAAAFADSVATRVKATAGSEAVLLQTLGICLDQDGITADSNLLEFADRSFAPVHDANQPPRAKAEINAVIERARSSVLEPALIEMFKAARSYEQTQNLNLAGERSLYFVFSAIDVENTTVALHLAELARWVFGSLFTNEVAEIEALVLLPQLFENPTQEHYSNAYSVLLELDYAMDTAVSNRKTLFDRYWLLDSANTNGIEFGTCAKNIEGYTDAFIGFITADFEKSQAWSVAGRSRGKVASYNSFGHAELFLPSKEIAHHLATQLSIDTLNRSYLPSDLPPPDSRRFLISAKQFVLDSSVTNALDNAERDKGALIWRDFDPREVLKRDLTAHETVAELARVQTKYDQEATLHNNQKLLASGQSSKDQILEFLRASVDKQADAEPAGLLDAYEFLRVLVSPEIDLEHDTLGEHPRNLATLFREIQAELDTEMSVELPEQEGPVIEERVFELRTRLKAINSSLGVQPLESTAVVLNEESEPSTGTDQGDTPGNTSAHEEQNVEAREVKSELQSLVEKYPKANARDAISLQQARMVARQKIVAEADAAITAAEEEFVRVDRDLGDTKRILSDLQDRRRSFLNRKLIVQPLLAAVIVIGLPVLGALVGISPLVALLALITSNLGSTLVFITVSALIYLGTVAYQYNVGVGRLIREATQSIERLQQSLKASLRHMIDARNRLLRWRFRFLLQDTRADAIRRVIENAAQQASTIADVLAKLRSLRETLVKERDSFTVSKSPMRYPVLDEEDSARYYSTLSGDEVRDLADTFASTQAPRSTIPTAFSEFQDKLRSYSLNRFGRLRDLSIGDVLLRERELMSTERSKNLTVLLGQRAQPLLPLSEISDGPTFAEEEIAVMAEKADGDLILDHFRSVNGEASLVDGSDRRSLRVLTVCHNIPAYFLGRLRYYLSCYERDEREEGEIENLPGLIPAEYLFDIETRRARESLLLAMSLGIVAVESDGTLTFENGERNALGTSSEEVVNYFLNDFKGHKTFDELCDVLQTSLSDRSLVHDKLKVFSEKAPENTFLNHYDRKALDTLIRKYNPLS